MANSIGDFPTGASAEVIQSAEKKKIYFFLTIIGRDAYKVAHQNTLKMVINMCFTCE